MTTATRTSEYLSTSDAARLIGLTPDAIRAMERSGRLPAIRTAGGIRLFRVEDVEKVAAERADAQDAGGSR